MSRHIYVNRYAHPVGEPYRKLMEILADKEYFVITTNVDHQFQKAGIDKQRLFYTQGDYGLWQCSVPCATRPDLLLNPNQLQMVQPIALYVRSRSDSTYFTIPFKL
jgi:NAD-dependent SIR2 family protein deacetylase